MGTHGSIYVKVQHPDKDHKKDVYVKAFWSHYDGNNLIYHIKNIVQKHMNIEDKYERYSNIVKDVCCIGYDGAVLYNNHRSKNDKIKTFFVPKMEYQMYYPETFKKSESSLKDFQKYNYDERVKHNYYISVVSDAGIEHVIDVDNNVVEYETNDENDNLVVVVKKFDEL